MKLPQTRTADILEQEAGAELLIYDLRIHKAYHLNETSKIVFQACHAGMDFDELKCRHKFSDDLIWLALDELRNNDLIVSEAKNHFAGLSRREVIRRVGLASAAALPMIVGLTAPTAAYAASTCTGTSSPNNAPGCPVGLTVVQSSSTCAGTPDSTRSSNCNSFFRAFCSSGNAVYASGSCTDVAGGTQYNCVCA